MSGNAPIEAFWTGEVFQPCSPYWARRADRVFTRGEVLRLVDEPQRSNAAHNHYFASIQNAFDSLPPLVAERFNSPDALRKYALIKGGFCDSDSVTCPSHADALRVAAFIRPMDEFALVTVKKNVVTRFVPKSQSFRSMGKEEFQASKTSVLEIIADLIGVSAAELQASAPTAADYMGAG